MPRKTKRQVEAELAALTADARNRALRSFVQGLAIDVLMAATLVIVEATSAVSVDWRLMAASLLRSCVQAAASFAMRRFLDTSRVPTPLPPTPQPEPADPA